jgi:hypothetical protein
MFTIGASRRREHGSTTSEPSGESPRRPEAHDRHSPYNPRKEVDDPRRSDRGDPGFKKEKELTFEAIAQKVGAHKVWTTAALLGQHPMSPEAPSRPTRGGTFRPR